MTFIASVKANATWVFQTGCEVAADLQKQTLNPLMDRMKKIVEDQTAHLHKTYVHPFFEKHIRPTWDPCVLSVTTWVDDFQQMRYLYQNIAITFIALTVLCLVTGIHTQEATWFIASLAFLAMTFILVDGEKEHRAQVARGVEETKKFNKRTEEEINGLREIGAKFARSMAKAEQEADAAKRAAEKTPQRP